VSRNSGIRRIILIECSGADLVGVVHSHSTASGWEVIHLPLLVLPAVRRAEHDLEFAGLVDDKVCGLVLGCKNQGSLSELDLTGVFFWFNPVIH